MQRSVLLSMAMLAASFVVGPLPVPGPVARPVAPRAEVLVLGVYHMDNPGRDVFNVQADDVLAPKRQQEIAQLLKVLKEFRPTKIAVECVAGQVPLAQEYADYLAGRRELTRNEVEQIGYRLARELGQGAVHPVDADGDFPVQRLAEYAESHGRAQEYEALMGVIGDRVKAQSDFLASHTVLEMLLRMNSDEVVADDVGFYYRTARFGEDGDWPGADLVSEWFRRNMRIHSNILRLIGSPDERVLVIFGAGHLGWLQRNVLSDPTLRLRKLAEFVK